MQNFQSFSKIVCSLCISQIKQAMCINASIPVVSARFTDGVQTIHRSKQAYHNKSIHARTLAVISPNISSAIRSTRFSAIFFKMEVVFVNSLISSRLALSISGSVGMTSFTNPACLYLPLLYIARYSSPYLLYASANSFSSGQIRLKNDLILL